jgi:hypothetical protein
MRPKVRWVSCLTVAGLAVYLLLAPAAAPREPFGDAGWEVESVMVLDANATKFALEPPFRVLRGGRVTLSRPEESRTLPVVRVDLNIDDEHIIVFARVRQTAQILAAPGPDDPPPPAAAK